MTDDLLPDPLPDPPSKQWWIIPLISGILLFLAGVGVGLWIAHYRALPQTVGEPTPVTTTQIETPAQKNPTTPENMVTLQGSKAIKPESMISLQPQTIAEVGTIPELIFPPTLPQEVTGNATESQPPTASDVPPIEEEKTPPKNEISAQTPPTGHDKTDGAVQYEENLPHDPLPIHVEPPANRRDQVRIAIIIDDLGYNGATSLAIARLAEPITLAILPGGKFSRQTAQIGKATHKEILLHQPMEPLGYPRVKPGPGGMYMNMDKDQLNHVLLHNLKLFPEAIGINNHMGSRLTKNRIAMDVVMETLTDRGLIFVDSRTSQTSIAYARAQARKLPSAKRDVFLDNIHKESAIAARLAELERLAHHTGQAIGIGHPYPETLHALQKWLPAASKRGIQIEPISHFLHPALSSASPVTQQSDAPDTLPENTPLTKPKINSTKEIKPVQQAITAPSKPASSLQQTPVLKQSPIVKQAPVVSTPNLQTPIPSIPNEYVLPVEQTP